jgi:hypothetical protein
MEEAKACALEKLGPLVIPYLACFVLTLGVGFYLCLLGVGATGIIIIEACKAKREACYLAARDKCPQCN